MTRLEFIAGVRGSERYCVNCREATDAQYVVNQTLAQRRQGADLSRHKAEGDGVMFTNGVARYLRRVNLGDYQHAEASAEISWSAVDRPAEAEQLAAKAATLARSQVEQQLGIGGKASGNPTVVTAQTLPGAPSLADAAPKLPDPAGMTVTPPVANAQPMTVKDLQSAGLSVTEIENVNVGTQTIADPAGMTDKAALAASMTNGGSGEIVTSKGGVPVSQLRAAFGTGRKPKSATQVVEAGPTVTAPTQPLASPAPTPEPSTAGQSLMSSEPMPVEIWQGTPAAKTYTVAELGRACSEASLRLKAAGDAAPSVTIMDLVGKFGKATNAIPEDKRAEFLAELALLEPRK